MKQSKSIISIIFILSILYVNGSILSNVEIVKNEKKIQKNSQANLLVDDNNNNNNNNIITKTVEQNSNSNNNNNDVINNESPEGRDTAFHYVFESCKSDQSNMTVQVDKLNGSNGIPSWVRATKFNNGFGKFEGEDFQFNYLFDVMAYIVKWQIVGNTVTFANKFIQSEYFQIAEKSTPTYRTFGGVKPPMTTKEKIQTLAHLVSDNLNVNVQRFGNRLLAISDMSGEMEIDPDTLDTRGLLKWNDTITDKFTMITCAHPSQLAGEKYVYNYHVHLFSNFPHLGKLDTFELYRIDTSHGDTLTREVILKLPISNGYTPYMHSFAHTPNYIVFFRFPLMWDIMKIPFAVNILPAMVWKPDDQTLVHVIDLKTQQIVQNYTMDPFFAYHHINAFENKNGDVVVDITTVPCEGSDGAAACKHMNSFELETLRNNSYKIPKNTLKRFIVPVKSGGGKIIDGTKSLKVQTSFDLPHVNKFYKGKPYRYIYGTGDQGDGVWWNTLIKIDTETGETKEWYKPNHFPTEPDFLPAPGATSEDDGVLVSNVLSGDLNTSYLLVLNATTMEPLARALAPHYLPYVSHGFACMD